MNDVNKESAKMAFPEVERDLMVYGNAVVHYANIDGKLTVRPLNPLEVFPDLKVVASDA